ncbi:MAG: extracellular solute-binding protein [Anaerolineae bacterium]
MASRHPARALMAVGLALWVAFLAACAAGPNAAQGPASPAAGPTVAPRVKLTYWEEEADDGDVVLDGLAAGFMRQNPTVAVERVHLSYEELVDRIESGATAPDLVRCISDCTAAVALSGRFRPAADLFDRAFLARFLPGAVEAARFGATVWGIPDNYEDVLLLIYNRNLVEAPAADTDAWIGQLRALTDADADRYGLAYNLNEPYWLIPWIGGFGGWILDEADRPTLDTPAMVEALRFVDRLHRSERVTPLQADYDVALDYFRQGRAAYLIDGTWSLERLHEAKIPFGVTALPRVSATGLVPTPLATARHWFFGATDDPERSAAARAFVEFMTSADAQERWLSRAQRLPSRREVAAGEAIAADPLLRGIMAQLAGARGLPAAPAMRCVWSAMRPALEATMAGQTSPEAAARAMQKEAERCMTEMSGR